MHTNVLHGYGQVDASKRVNKSTFDPVWTIPTVDFWCHKVSSTSNFLQRLQDCRHYRLSPPRLPLASINSRFINSINSKQQTRWLKNCHTTCVYFK
jgi:hypothetical protein